MIVGILFMNVFFIALLMTGPVSVWIIILFCFDDNLSTTIKAMDTLWSDTKEAASLNTSHKAHIIHNGMVEIFSITPTVHSISTIMNYVYRTDPPTALYLIN